MNKNIELKRQIFDRKKFHKTVNNSFSELISPPDPTFFDVNLGTVDDFFILYDRLFYDIPQTGEINSHEYLVKTSGDYINFESNNEEIQLLIDEITKLRELNLQLQQENIQLRTGIDVDFDTNQIIEDVKKDRQGSRPQFINPSTQQSSEITTTPPPEPTGEPTNQTQQETTGEIDDNL